MTDKQGFIFWNIFWLIFVVVGGGAIVYQHWLMRTYSPVTAIIVSTGVKHLYNDEDEHVEATPRVRYEFQYKGRPHHSSNLYALPVVFAGDGGVSVAKLLAEQYQPGDRIVAFVNPHDPTQAFIHPSFLPYIFPLFAGTAIFAGFVSTVRSRLNGSRKILWTGILAVTALLCGTGLTFHFYSISPGPHETLPAISLLCYTAIWVAVLANATVLTRNTGWQGAVRAGSLLVVVGLYLGLMLWVVMLVGSGWLRWFGLEISVAGLGVHFMLWVGGALGMLGAALGLFGAVRISASTQPSSRTKRTG